MTPYAQECITSFRAEAYALAEQLGRPVIPLGPDGTPLVSWRGLVERDDPPAPSAMRCWPWHAARGAAIVLGHSRRLGGWLWVLDVERPHRWRVEAELDAERPGWRQSVVVQTQRLGVHLVATSERPVRPARFIGGDVLGCGKLAVLPPTPPYKPDGQQPYQWLSCNVDELIDAGPSELLPAWWFDDEPDGTASVPATTRRPASGLGAALTELARQPGVLERVLETLGLPRTLDPRGSGAVLCRFCRERHPSMSLWTAPNGELVLRVWHRCAGVDGAEFVPLPTAYAALVTGQFRLLTGAAYVAWKLRLLADAGVLPVLPAPSASDADTLADTLRWLAAVNAHLTGERAVVASRAFLTELLGWPERRVRDAFRQLLTTGRIERADCTGPARWVVR